MRILIVEDHVLFREGLVSLLEKHADLTVVGEADSVNEAVTKALELKPDLILMDISLPDGSGLDAVTAILYHLPETKIIMLTIHESSDLLLDAIRAGARGYLLKNTPVNNLIASLQAVERGEAALSRTLTTQLVDKVSRSPRTILGEKSGIVNLTSRETDVLRELSTNASNKEISERLYISENTVRYYVHKILAKLELKNRREAAEYARRKGFGKTIDLQEDPET